MMQEEEVQALREENQVLKALVAELLPLREEVARLKEQVKQLEDRLEKDSRTSSKPPSSDGLSRLPRSSRCPSGKEPGGQPGHRGQTRMMVQTPDEVVSHRPAVCEQCQQPLSEVAGELAERRQVLDLPEIRRLVQEHQIEAVCCPKCHTTTRGSFPIELQAPVQYGPTVQALAVYLHQGQLLPLARTCEVLSEICGSSLSEGSIVEWCSQAAERLAPTVARIGDLIAASPLQHGDETGIRIYGMLHWLHVNSTPFSPIWHGMPPEARRRWTRSASGLVLPGEGCTTAWPVMMPTTVSIASAGLTCCYC